MMAPGALFVNNLFMERALFAPPSSSPAAPARPLFPPPTDNVSSTPPFNQKTFVLKPFGRLAYESLAPNRILRPERIAEQPNFPRSPASPPPPNTPGKGGDP